jgi:hypothetical protein
MIGMIQGIITTISKMITALIEFEYEEALEEMEREN